MPHPACDGLSRSPQWTTEKKLISVNASAVITMKETVSNYTKIYEWYHLQEADCSLCSEGTSATSAKYSNLTSNFVYCPLATLAWQFNLVAMHCSVDD